MITYTFFYGRINILQEDIAEFIFQDGTEITKEIVEHFHAFLQEHFKPPFSILVNKLNDYAYTFEAQQSLFTIPGIHAIAIVSYNITSQQCVNYLINFPRSVKWNTQTFHHRESALQWLQAQQKKVNKNSNTAL